MAKALLIALVALAAGGCLADRDEERQEATQKPVEVSLDPESLLQKGAMERIQEALGEQGHGGKWKRGSLDIETSAALQRAQRAHKLPATGVPDARTVEVLGLAAADIFERRDSSSP